MNGRALALGSVAVLASWTTLSRRDAKALTLGVVTRAAVDDAVGSLARAGPVTLADRVRFDAIARDARILFREADRTGNFTWDDAMPWGKARGLTALGSGMWRAVFRDDRDPRRVLKVNIYDGKSSRSELQVWREAPDWLRPYLVPVLGAGKDGRWILMEYAKPAKQDASRVQDLAALPPEIMERMMACGLSDLYAQNMAADGRLLDYGYLQHDAWRFCTKGIKPKHTWATPSTASRPGKPGLTR